MTVRGPRCAAGQLIPPHQHTQYCMLPPSCPPRPLALPQAQVALAGGAISGAGALVILGLIGLDCCIRR